MIYRSTILITLLVFLSACAAVVPATPVQSPPTLAIPPTPTVAVPPTSTVAIPPTPTVAIPPTPTTRIEPTSTLTPVPQKGDVTNAVARIVLEQGSGAACKQGSTYFAYVDITASGVVAADYMIYLTDASGQVINGVFYGYTSPTGNVDKDFNSPQLKGTLKFTAAGTQSIMLRVTGPYSYPDSVTVRLSVNGKAWQEVTAKCQ